MRISVKRHWACLGLMGVVHFATVAHAQEAVDEPIGPPLIADAVDELDRWVPSLSISLGLLMQEVEGDIESTDILGPTDQTGELSPLLTIRPPASGSDLTLTPISGGSFEFMSPGLRSIPFFPDIEIPGSPRLFAHGDFLATFTLTYRTAKEGDPKPPSLPESFLIQGADLREPVVFGQGSVLETEIKRWSFSAGAGIAFTVDLFERRFRLKPSFEWMTEEIQIEGEARRAIALVNRPKKISDFRYELFRAKKSRRFYGLGGGIEFELDTRRAGPFLVSVFGNTQIYRMMGDRKIKARATNSFGEEVEFEIERSRWTYRAATGLRVRLAVE